MGDASSHVSANPSNPQRLGEFEIIREIGRGGMGGSWDTSSPQAK